MLSAGIFLHISCTQKVQCSVFPGHSSSLFVWEGPCGVTSEMQKSGAPRKNEKMKNSFSIRCLGKVNMFKCGCFSKSFYSDRCNLILDSENVSVHLLSNPAFESTGAKEPTAMRAPAGEGKERAPAERLPALPEVRCWRGAHWNWYPKSAKHPAVCPCRGLWWSQSGTHHLKEALLGLELFPLCLWSSLVPRIISRASSI